MRVINKACKAPTTGLRYRFIPLSRFWGEQREQKNEKRMLSKEVEHGARCPFASVRKGHERLHGSPKYQY